MHRWEEQKWVVKVARTETELYHSCRGTAANSCQGRKIVGDLRRLTRSSSSLLLHVFTLLFVSSFQFCSVKYFAMAPKPRVNASVLTENVVNQAVIIADSFDDHFHGLTLDRPKALIPLLNQPLIDYSLGLLKYNGVQEVFLFCSQHHKKIRDHIKNDWSDSSEMVVHVFSSNSYLSPGDVFRG